MAAWRYKNSLFVLKKYFTRSLRSLVNYFLTLEEKFHISAEPCNILYILPPYMYCMHVLSKAFNQSTENIHASNIFSALMSYCSQKNKGKVTIFYMVCDKRRPQTGG